MENKICALSMYSKMLANKGIHVSEGELMIYGKGITFEYYYFSENTICNINYAEDMYLIGMDDVKKNLKEVGIYFQEKSFKTTEQQYRYILKQLQTNEQMIVLIDSFYLDFSVNYKKHHSSYMVLGYAYEGGYVKMYTVDEEHQHISIDENIFREMIWRQKHIGTNSYMGIIELISVEEKKLNKINIYSKEIAQKMLNDNEKQKGIDAITNLANEIMFWSDFLEESVAKRMFNSVYTCILSRGGPAISRKLYADMIESTEGKNEISSLMYESSGLWNVISVKAFRLSRKIDNEKVLELAKTMQDVFVVEKKVWEIINYGL